MFIDFSNSYSANERLGRKWTMGEEINREHKDRLFCFLFGREENRKWTLELYNALNGTNYLEESDIVFNTLKDAVYMGMKNDVSFLLSSVLSLYEQQSTYNPNMPVRQLMYLGKIYDKYIHQFNLNIYGKRLIKLPVPKLVTFYNGIENHEDKILRLSDSLDSDSIISESDVEVNVRMININHERGSSLLKKCRPLYEYSWFVDRIRLNNKTMEIEPAVDKAFGDMPENFVIRKCIELNKAEVTDMCLTEYDEAKTMEMFKEEGREEGREERDGEILKAIESGATIDDIKRMLVFNSKL